MAVSTQRLEPPSDGAAPQAEPSPPVSPPIQTPDPVSAPSLMAALMARQVETARLPAAGLPAAIAEPPHPEKDPGSERADDLPPVALVRRYDTHRMVPVGPIDPASALPEGLDGAGFVGGEPLDASFAALRRIAEDGLQWQALVELDRVTDAQLIAENDRLPGIGLAELIFGMPFDAAVNAAFCHAHPLGRRFADPERGAWTCAFEPETALAEFIFHHTVVLGEVGRFEDTVIVEDHCADLSATLHDLRTTAANDLHPAGEAPLAPEASTALTLPVATGSFADCLAPDSYQASQGLSRDLLDAGALGLVYPSQRHPGGTCVACFRPAMLTNIRAGARYRIEWTGSPEPRITPV